MLLVACWVALLGLYVAAKIDFFTHYGAANYVREHSKYWIAMLGLGLVIWIVDRSFPPSRS
jgi:hypothetical protein